MTNPISSAANRFRTWRERARGRAELGRLGERTLNDIGISVPDARFEASKPFWRD